MEVGVGRVLALTMRSVGWVGGWRRQGGALLSPWLGRLGQFFGRTAWRFFAPRRSGTAACAVRARGRSALDGLQVVAVATLAWRVPGGRDVVSLR